MRPFAPVWSSSRRQSRFAALDMSGYSARRASSAIARHSPGWVASLVDDEPGRIQPDQRANSRMPRRCLAAHSPKPSLINTDAYAHLSPNSAGIPYRIWNFVPQIQAVALDGDRYMAFNAGRFAAFADWFGDLDEFPRAMPTASAVGIRGSTLWIHVLACQVFWHTRREPPADTRHIATRPATVRALRVLRAQPNSAGRSSSPAPRASWEKTRITLATSAFRRARHSAISRQ